MTTVRQSQYSQIAIKSLTSDSTVSASYAVTASYALNGGGGSVSTSSLLTTASFNDPNLTFTKGNGSTFDVDISSLTIISASYALTASFIDGGKF